MRMLIIFYSRTGNTRIAATMLAQMLGADLAEIKCDRHGKGPFRYLRAGYESVKGVLPAIDAPVLTPDHYDVAVIAGPIWTSHPSLPIRAYLAQTQPLPDRLALLMTHQGLDPARAVSEAQALLPQPAAETLTLVSKDIENGEIRPAVEDFAERIRRLGAEAPRVVSLSARTAS